MVAEITVNNSDEFQELVDNKDIRIAKAIVEGILKNITTKKKHVHVLSVTCLEEGEVYDITVERQHFASTLEENLPYYIREEYYEECTKIVNIINELKNPVVKQRGRPKKV
jgi:UDP-N-acetylglucosamine transferase subunit ALG13